MESESFVTVFKRTCHQSVSRARWIQSTPSDTSYNSHFNIIFSSAPMFPTDFIPSGYSTKINSRFHLRHAVCMPLPSHPPWFHYPNDIWWRVQIVERFICTRLLSKMLWFELGLLLNIKASSVSRVGLEICYFSESLCKCWDCALKWTTTALFHYLTNPLLNIPQLIT
jgi:hypothetical protein